jgi:hypothetical protein
MPELTAWSSFYSIVGEAAASLTGLQFISMALIAEVPLGETNADDKDDPDSGSGSAFSTPSIVQFGTVLLLSGTMVAPWHSLLPIEILFTLAGIVGFSYIAHNAWEFTHQTYYKPVVEDWIMRIILPLSNYALLLAAALLLSTHPAALFCIAATAFICLSIGIHNAWDNVTYLVYMKRKRLNA